MQTVKLGPSDGQRVAILDGLKAGEQVVIDGADRLKDGAKITVAPPPAGRRRGRRARARQAGMRQAARRHGGAAKPAAATAGTAAASVTDRPTASGSSG